MSLESNYDEVFFAKSIEIFKRPVASKPLEVQLHNTSVILPPFPINNEWSLPDININQIHNDRFGRAEAFVCHIQNPPWVNRKDARYYAIALSAILSFATGRLWKAATSAHLNNRISPTESYLTEMALRNPVLTAGAGAQLRNPSEEDQAADQRNTSKLIETLHGLKPKQYQAAMQAIRLVHLSMMGIREDYGLGYLLIVSALESAAQVATKRSDYDVKHENLPDWESVAETNHACRLLLEEYKKMQVNNKHLTKRYVDFIFKYCPLDSWPSLIKSSLRLHFIGFAWHYSNIMQTELAGIGIQSYDEIRTLIGDSYKFRSKYVHEGKTPPNTQKNADGALWELMYKDENPTTPIKLPTYTLLFLLAQYSISAWCGCPKQATHG